MSKDGHRRGGSGVHGIGGLRPDDDTGGTGPPAAAEARRAVAVATPIKAVHFTEPANADRRPARGRRGRP